MKNIDSVHHVRGESIFIDDVKVPENTLSAYVFYSPIASGKILKLDFSEALKSKGVKGIFSAKDIPGENQIGGIIQDENLFAEEEVHFVGHPIAIVVAEKYLQAKEASKKIHVEFEKHKPILSPREAAEKKSFIIPPRIFQLGNTENAWKECDYVFEGKVESGGQEHIYLETQGAVAIPIENELLKIYSATQSPTAVQRTIARILAISMNKVEVNVHRLGGGFGGKEDQATAWACMAALAAYKLKTPVKLILNRQDDIRITGKRHPYSSDYKIGLTKEGKILAYEVTFYQNAGAAADLSPAILDRTLFHCTNSYFIPNVKATGLSCKTNLIPFTAFRGFGGPQGMFVIESAIHHAANEMNIPVSEIQKKNLLKENDEFSYGQKAVNSFAIKSFKLCEEKFELKKLQDEVEFFNSKNFLVKKGLAIIPITFGISFTTTFLNQASALIHIYTDGSINVSTAAVEMGQGVNAKLKRIAAKTLSVDENRINVDSTNTSRVANTSPTAASKGTDLNGFAVIDACNILLERLKKVAAEELGEDDWTNITFKNEKVFDEDEPTTLTFTEIVRKAYIKRISLTAQAFHSTPNIYFDPKINKGNPFAYHVYGTAIIQVTLDCLRGTYETDFVKVVHDFGESFHNQIDIGQVEGGIVQGIGWMSSEELIWNNEGKLLTDALSTYKVPDIHAIPKEITIVPLPYDKEKLMNDEFKDKIGPLNSKAIGEPPFMYGIGFYFALFNAIKSFNPKINFIYNSPLTPEKVLMMLYEN
ncbi:MAG: molybdopterin-dependent oxidoreductase [Melioribacteraceae bacterium]|nr:molybdopterin-dependent oxidoreductase [Melioribacteraceae bacterium]